MAIIPLFHRHIATWSDDGKRILHRDGDKLKATCRVCGAPIVRRRAWQSWWWIEGTVRDGGSPSTEAPDGDNG